MIVEQLFHIKINEVRDSANYLLSDYFLAHKHQMRELTLKQVIYDTALSKSTIIRFFQYLGCANYTQFAYDYMEEIAQRQCRERVLLKSHEQDEEKNTEFNQFVTEVARGILSYRKLMILGELRDVLLAEPYISHLFDLDIACDIIWDMPGAQPIELPKDAYYLLLMSHYTPSNFIVKAREIIAEQVKQIIEDTTYEKGILSYPIQAREKGTYLEISRKMRPMDKKILLLTLFGEIHNALLYGMKMNEGLKK